MEEKIFVLSKEEQKDYLESFLYFIPCNFKVTEFYSIMDMQFKGKSFNVWDGKVLPFSTEIFNDTEKAKAIAKSAIRVAVAEAVEAAKEYSDDIEAIDFYISEPIDIMAGIRADGSSLLRAAIYIDFVSKSKTEYIFIPQAKGSEVSKLVKVY